MQLREWLLLLVLLHLCRCCIANAQLESLWAPVFSVPAQSVSSSKLVAAEVALVVARLEMYL